MMREENQWSCGAPHQVIIIRFDESISNFIAISGEEMSIPNKKWIRRKNILFIIIIVYIILFFMQQNDIRIRNTLICILNVK